MGRAVASDIRDPRFESQHHQSFIFQLQLNGKEKEARNGPFKKQLLCVLDRPRKERRILVNSY